MLEQILQAQQEILMVLKDISAHLMKTNALDASDHDELLDNSDAKQMLKVTDSTLYRWRKQHLIEARRIGKKDYYLKSDLERILKNRLNNSSNPEV
jgi:hypothetical protein